MKKTLLFCFIAFAVNHSKAQYSLDASFGPSPDGFFVGTSMNSVPNLGNVTDDCKKLLKLPNGNTLMVGSVRYTNNGDDLDVGYFEIDPSGNEVDQYQSGSGSDEFVTDALVQNGILYYTGFQFEPLTMVAQGFVGQIDLTTKVKTHNLLPITDKNWLNAITTDGTSLYYGGYQQLAGGEVLNLIVKTDLSLAYDNSFGMGGFNYPAISGGTNQYVWDMIYSSLGLIIVGHINSTAEGYIAVLNSATGSTNSAFTPFKIGDFLEPITFYAVAENPADASIVAVGKSETASSIGFTAKLTNTLGLISYSPSPNATELTDVVISGNHIFSCGNSGANAYLESRDSDLGFDNDFNYGANQNYFTISTNPGFDFNGNSLLIDGSKLILGGRINNFGAFGSAMFASQYTSNGVGISENNANTDFSVFPNPVVDVLNIESKNQQVESIEIINQVGQVVKTSTNTSSINCSDLESGSYFIRVNKNEVSKFNKL
ncbi:MAG: Secretion system C-terminal sorting domain [Bacteroidota bacterium]|jgi:hypothetical protein